MAGRDNSWDKTPGLGSNPAPSQSLRNRGRDADDMAVPALKNSQDEATGQCGLGMPGEGAGYKNSGRKD